MEIPRLCSWSATTKLPFVKAIFAGTFDPPTWGHWDVIERSLPLFEEFYIVVANNSAKTPLLNLNERIELLKAMIETHGKTKYCKVISTEGLVADLCKKLDVQYLVRGVRSASDFERELPMSVANEILSATEVKTILIPSTKENSFVSSSLVREIFGLGGDVSAFVPPVISDFLKAKGVKK